MFLFEYRKVLNNYRSFLFLHIEYNRMSKLVNIEEDEPIIEEEIEQVVEKIPKTEQEIFEKRNEPSNTSLKVEAVVTEIEEEKPKKKKRQLSEKQLAHLERIRKIKLDKNKKAKQEGKKVVNKRKPKEKSEVIGGNPQNQSNMPQTQFLDHFADYIYTKLDTRLSERERKKEQQAQLRKAQGYKNVNTSQSKPVAKKVTKPKPIPVVQKAIPPYNPYDNCFN